MLKIITVDPENKGKDKKRISIEEDGFGIKEKEIFVAISLLGFSDNQKALIFTFTDIGIVVTLDNVLVVAGYKLDKFNDILCIAENTVTLNDDKYHLNVLNKTFNLYLKCLSKKRKMSSREVTTNILLLDILTHLYQEIGAYYNMDAVNLKNSHFIHFCNEVVREKSIII